MGLAAGNRSGRILRATRCIWLRFLRGGGRGRPHRRSPTRVFPFEAGNRANCWFLVTSGFWVRQRGTNSIGAKAVHLYAEKSACSASACVLSSLSLSSLRGYLTLKYVRLHAL